MRKLATIAVALVLGGAAGAATVPPPVMNDLEYVEPTPEPTPKPYWRKRLITTLTVQNTPEGDTVVMFEAADVAQYESAEKKSFKTLAAERYTLSTEDPKLRAARKQVLGKLRELEEAILDYVEAAGPPSELKVLKQSGQRRYED